ncbi:FecCD family ABC transporter permease [Microlunatus parietis]|uniref:Iron complex transport system permease protein n=1 Tax=Microlunatus parietis TaxID=682979 RepID=A0A7Y9LA69_9ACTN|nr:iron ABC transporter permease [Microlunatus parietis]NYE69463.1 iron complex transport system permease protein [Microlunatus parietis]
MTRTAVDATALASTGAGRTDDLDHRRRRVRVIVWITGLAGILIISIPVSVGLGPVWIGPGTVIAIVLDHLGWAAAVPGQEAADSIVWQVRIPRVLLAVVVGAALAISGAALQALVRNVLAEPYLLGVSAGASTGAALTLLFGFGATIGAGALTGSAFLGALAATALVFVLATRGGKITSVRLLLAGVAVGYVLNAATSFLIFASDTPEGARAVLFWLLGSLTRASWTSVLIASPIVLAGLMILVVISRRLDALSLGDDTALALGSSPTRVRAQGLAVVALCVGAAVAVSGGIGFVGLIVPHVARLLVGGVHRRLLPVAALLGASFLIWCDVAARMIFVPRELPLGIITAVAGAPFLIFLVRRMRTTS